MALTRYNHQPRNQLIESLNWATKSAHWIGRWRHPKNAKPTPIMTSSTRTRNPKLQGFPSL